MWPITIVTTTLLTTLLIACTGGSDGGDDDYRQAAGKAVQAAVLTFDDLPNGWAPSALTEETYTNFALTGDCARLNGRGAGFPGEVASADSEPFTGPVGQELINTVSAFTGPEAAGAAVRLANDLVLQCVDQLEDALRKAIEVAAADRNVDRLIGDINATVEPASFQKLGDETLAYALHANFSAFFQRFEVNGHILVIRNGPLAGVLAYATLGDPGPQEEEEIAGVVATKLAAAEPALPD